MALIWHNMTWEEIGKEIAAGVDGALLPIGATEQHGPHLGCGMDSEIAIRLCETVAEICRVFLLPPLLYGCSIGHSQRWPGTIALQPKTMIDVVKDMGDWLYASGIRRLFLINSHVTNFAPLRCTLEMLRAEHDDMMIALINSAEISERVKQQHFTDAQDWHANSAETALMLALAPQLTRENKIASADDEDRTEDSVFSHPVNRTSLNGVTGHPSKASKKQGEELFAEMVEDLCELIDKGMREEAPLPHSYYDQVPAE